jgi:hypothetical protein
MNYRMKRHITNTLLYVSIITALIFIIRIFSISGAIIFAVVSVALLIADRYVETEHLKEEERKKSR